MRPTLAFVAIVLAAGAGACTALIGSEDRYYEADGTDASDRDVTASATDAAPRPDAAGVDATATEAAAPDATPDADDGAETGSDGGDVNVVDNPSFENGIVDSNCGLGWNVEQAASITTSTLSHSGLASCMICNSGKDLGYLAMDLPTPDAGAVIVASAWVAVPPATVSDAGTTSLGISLCYVGCDTEYSANYVPEPVPSWTLLRGQQVTVQADAGATQIQIDVETGCVLVDDVSVIYQ